MEQAKKFEWLLRHEVSEDDMRYAEKEIQSYLRQYESSITASISRLNSSNQRRIRLYEAMDHDYLRDAFVNRYVAHSRQKLDARNSEGFPKEFYQKVSDLYNTRSWIPTSRVFNTSEVGLVFPIALRLQENYLYTATNVKDKLSEARAAVLVVSTFHFYNMFS